MGLHLDPRDSDPVREQGGASAADLGGEQRLVRRGSERIGHGALICPDCALPLSIDRGIAAGSWLSCGYCATEGPARSFFVRDVYDTTANEVYLVARLG